MSASSHGSTVIHIGLGKTATTFLQSDVFPLLEKHGVVDSFNDPQLLAASAKHHLVGLSERELSAFAARLQELGRVFISDESLSAWNPADWRAARDKNVQLFGPDTKVIITIRDPLPYLTSVYLQYLEEGNIKEPSEFFIADEVHEALKPVLPRFHEAVFAIQQFDLSLLIKMYQDVYSSVVVVRMEDVFLLEFLAPILDIAEPTMAVLRAASRRTSRKNVSYSATAVKMTFARERLLRAFGAKSVGTTDFELRRLLMRAQSVDESKLIDARGLNERIALIEYVLKRLKWTYLMQRIVDRIVPYRRYSLPAGVVPDDVLLRNVEFYRRLDSGSVARLSSAQV